MTDDATKSGSELILYETEDGRTRIECRFEGETIWLTQALIADLFQKDVRTINEHLVNIFDEGELSRDATIRKLRIVRTEGKRKVAREIEQKAVRARHSNCSRSAPTVAFCDPAGRRGQVPRIRALIEYCRSVAVPVIFSRRPKIGWASRVGRLGRGGVGGGRRAGCVEPEPAVRRQRGVLAERGRAASATICSSSSANVAYWIACWCAARTASRSCAPIAIASSTSRQVRSSSGPVRAACASRFHAVSWS